MTNPNTEMERAREIVAPYAKCKHRVRKGNVLVPPCLRRRGCLCDIVASLQQETDNGA